MQSYHASPRPSPESSLIEYLSAHRLFGVLPRPAIPGLATDVIERRYPRGHNLCFTGDPPTFLFIVRSGLVALTQLDGQGDVHIILTLSPGDVFGMGATAASVRPTYTATALTETEVLLLPKDVFSNLCHDFPALTFQVIEELCGLFGKYQRTALRLGQATVVSRIAEFLLELAPTPSSSETTPPSLELPLSHEDLALLLGTSRETVTRALSRLSRAGLIATRGRHVLLTRPDALRRLAGV